MHTGQVTRPLRVGFLVVVLSGIGAGSAWAAGSPTPPPPVVVTQGFGQGNVLIGVHAPGGGSAGGAPVPGGSGAPAVPIGGFAAPAAGGSGGSPASGSQAVNPWVALINAAATQQQCVGAPFVNPQVPCSLALPAPAPAAPGAAPAPPPPAPPAILLAQVAWGALRMPSPLPSRYPMGILKENGHPYTIVNAYTWFWTDPATFQPVSKTVTAGGVSATATATPVSLTFTPGDDGHPVTCKGPGQAWQPNDQTWLPPVNPQGCSYQYPNSSLGMGGDDQVTATYAITWKVTWTGSDGTSGAFNGLQTQTTSRFAVAEVQTVVVR